MTLAMPESARVILESALNAQLATVNIDGSPQVSLVSPLFDREQILLGHLAEHQKVRNIRREPRITLTYLPNTYRSDGREEYLIIHGTATITAGGAPALLAQITRKQHPERTTTPFDDLDTPGYITHITVERISGEGPWNL